MWPVPFSIGVSTDAERKIDHAVELGFAGGFGFRSVGW
jgi:hypothetical protein